MYGFHAKEGKCRSKDPELNDRRDPRACGTWQELVENTIEQNENSRYRYRDKKHVRGPPPGGPANTGGKLPSTAEPKTLWQDQERDQDDPT